MHLLPWLLAVTTVPATTTADVEAAARSYRVEIYAQFHTERQTYDRHINAADDLLHRWEMDGRGDQDAETVADWFRAARQAALNGAQAPTVPELIGVEKKGDALDEPRNPATQTPAVTEKPADKPMPGDATPPDSGKDPQVDEFADFDNPDDAAASQDSASQDSASQDSASQDSASQDANEQDTEPPVENGDSNSGDSAGAIDGIGRALRGLLAP